MSSARRRADALRPVERTRLYEDLIKRLGEFVRDSRMAVGDRFPAERELASRLGVSRASIRHSIVALEAQGSVEVRHGDGIFLRRTLGFGEPLYKLLERRRRHPEVHEAREALEAKLSELAAARRTDTDLEAMRSALERMRRDVEAGGVGVEGDEAFHAAIARAAHSPVLERLLHDIAEVVMQTRMESLSLPGRPAKSLAAHAAVLAAIEARRPDAAREAMLDHLKVVADVSVPGWEAGRARAR
jgi:GntR family transcriptional regulator, transcriptional repressor for pyruvate dehydrogenase complex